MANKHTIIVMVSIAVIAGSVGYSSLGAISAKDLQFRWHQIDSFDFIAVLVQGDFAVCNPTSIPANFESYSFSMNYDGNDLGTFVVGGGGVAPNTIGVVHGKLQSDDKRISEMFFSFLDTEFGGTDVARIDSNKMTVKTTIETKILGVIPYSITHDYSGRVFVDMMNQKTSCDK